MTTLADRVKRARREAGLSQRALADEAGVSRAAVAQWESGSTKTINSENLHAAADALNVEAEWLATGRSPKQKRNGGIGSRSSSDALAEMIESLPSDQRAAIQAVVDSLAKRPQTKI